MPLGLVRAAPLVAKGNSIAYVKMIAGPPCRLGSETFGDNMVFSYWLRYIIAPIRLYRINIGSWAHWTHGLALRSHQYDGIRVRQFDNAERLQEAHDGVEYWHEGKGLPMALFSAQRETESMPIRCPPGPPSATAKA